MEPAGRTGKHFQYDRRGNGAPGKQQSAGLWTALLADYESRRWFFSYEPRVVDGDIEKSFWQRALRALRRISQITMN